MNILSAIAYALTGIGVFVVVFALIDRLTPYKLWAEIIERQNVALAVLLGFMSLGVALIIAMAVH